MIRRALAQRAIPAQIDGSPGLSVGGSQVGAMQAAPKVSQQPGGGRFRKAAAASMIRKRR